MHATSAQPKSFLQMLKQTFKEWSQDRASTLAAALSYTAIFSLAPIIVVAVFVAGLFLGNHASSREVVHKQIASYLGNTSADFFDQVIQKTYESTAGNKAIWFTVISVVLLIYAATSLFTTLQDSLNVIWHVERNPRSTWRALLRDRLVTFIMVLAIGAFLLASVIFSTYLSAATHLLGDNPWLSRIADAALSLLIFTGLFALIMKYLPDAVITWRDVLIGAFFTAILFTLGKYALAFYLTRASTASAFGAAGSLIVILLFIYYSAQIFFLGAEFTSVYARRHGNPIKPSKNAICKTEPPKTEP